MVRGNRYKLPQQGEPPRVTSLTSNTPRLVVTSSRRPLRVASITKVCVPWPVSTTASTRSPFMAESYAADCGTPAPEERQGVGSGVGVAGGVRKAADDSATQ